MPCASEIVFSVGDGFEPCATIAPFMNSPEESTNGQQQADESDQLTEQQQMELANAELQQHYHDEYLRQLRLRSCPGCGEEDLF